MVLGNVASAFLDKYLATSTRALYNARADSAECDYREMIQAEKEKADQEQGAEMGKATYFELELVRRGKLNAHDITRIRKIWDELEKNADGNVCQNSEQWFKLRKNGCDG